jgi:hypothetical protein
MATTIFTVISESALNTAIRSIDVGANNAATNIAYAITITGSISLSSPLLAFNLSSGSSVLVEATNGIGGAQVETINGNGNQRGFFVYSGNGGGSGTTIAQLNAPGLTIRSGYGFGLTSDAASSTLGTDIVEMQGFTVTSENGSSSSDLTGLNNVIQSMSGVASRGTPRPLRSSAPASRYCPTTGHRF